MNLLRSLRRTFGSRTFRAEVLGHVVEARINPVGGETILLDGAPVSSKPWAYVSGNHEHFFTLVDPRGAVRNVEIRLEDRSGGLQASYRVSLNLDGQPLTTLPEVERGKYTRCPHCSYDLQGLQPVNDEVQCPECGRHTSAKLLG